MAFGTLADIFFQWETLGVFDFLLPFLLIFAIVFGILSSTKFMGEHKGIYAIIAVVAGLMTVRYTYSNFIFSAFIEELFPRLGIGIAILLAVLILVGMFIAREESRYWGYGLAAIGVIIAITVVYQSFDRLGLGFIGGIGSDFVGFIILAVLLIAIIIAVAAGGGSRGDTRGDFTFLPGWGGAVAKPPKTK